ncbi:MULTISPECIES: hypothetical protein, partial [unclassified Roseovarius]|uniref:hypothetical protein n=1 Tax=unclassified Roseovarius TaxID=2614913 RepID=UPI001C307635
RKTPRHRQINSLQGDQKCHAVSHVQASFSLSVVLRRNLPMGPKPSPRVHQLHPKVFMQYLAKPKSWEPFKANLLKKCGNFTEALLNQGPSTVFWGLKLPFRASHSGRGTIKI